MTEFWAIIAKAQTMRDGGIRVTLDLPESAIVQMAELAAYQINGVVVDVTVAPRLNDCKTVGNNNALDKGPKRKSEWTTAETESPN